MPVAVEGRIAMTAMVAAALEYEYDECVYDFVVHSYRRWVDRFDFHLWRLWRLVRS